MKGTKITNQLLIGADVAGFSGDFESELLESDELESEESDDLLLLELRELPESDPLELLPLELLLLVEVADLKNNNKIHKNKIKLIHYFTVTNFTLCGLILIIFQFSLSV